MSEWVVATGKPVASSRDLHWTEIARPLKLATAVRRATWAVAVDAEKEREGAVQQPQTPPKASCAAPVGANAPAGAVAPAEQAAPAHTAS